MPNETSGGSELRIGRASKRLFFRIHPAWIPVLAFLAAVVFFHLLGVGEHYESSYLLLAGNFVFSALMGFLVLYLVARSYYFRPTVGLLLFSCGVLAWVLAGLVGVITGLTAVNFGSSFENTEITIHNGSVWLSALCHLAAAALIMRPTPVRSRFGLWFVAGQVAAAGLIGLLTVATLAGWMPAFIEQGAGATELRQFTLLSSILMFAVTAILLLIGNRGTRSAFNLWYAMALALISVGLFGVMLASFHGSTVSWIGRGAQFLSGMYMFAAAMAAVRESNAWRLPLARALHETEQRYRTLFENMTEGFVLHEAITDAEGRPCDYRVLEANPAFEQITGLSREKLVGKRVLEAFPNLEYHWIENYGRVATTGQPIHIENYASDLSRWFEVFAYRTAPRQFAVIFTDITKRKQSEKALQDAKQRFELLATVSEKLLRSNNPQAIVEELCRLVMNQIDCEFFFNYLVEVPGKSMHLNAFAGIPKEVAKTMRELDFGVGICGCVVRDGQRIIAEDIQNGDDPRTELVKSYGIQAYCCHPLIFQSLPVGTLAFGTKTRTKFTSDEVALMKSVADQVAVAMQRLMTERDLLQSRQNLDRAQEVGQIGWWRLNTQQNVLTWSDETYRIFGEPIGTPLSYESFLDFVYPDDRQYVNAMWEASLQGEPYDIEHRIVAGGQVKWVREKAYIEFGDGGRVLGGFGITQDITQRKNAEESLRKANDELEQRVRERTAELQIRAEQLARLTSELTMAEQRERQRLAQVLHDGLQQLLVAARFRLSVLETSADGEMLQETLELGELLADSIETSRSLTAELSPPVLKSGLVPSMEWLARWMREKHGLDVVLEVNNGSLPLGENITILLFQSVRELLFNAVKHAGVREAYIEVTSADSQISLVVTDAGKGFDPTQLSDPEFHSRGFGLFAIRERLSLLGGHLKIESKPGHGSRFTLVAPLNKAARDAVSPGEPPKVSLSVTPPGESAVTGYDSPLRIALVDDHAVVRQGLATLLRREKRFQIVGEASDGKSALDLIRRIRPDVVLMDISMPGMDGIEATKIIREELPEISIIGLSMHDDTHAAEQICSAGAAAYLSKSGPVDSIVKAILACRGQ